MSIITLWMLTGSPDHIGQPQKAGIDEGVLKGHGREKGKQTIDAF